MKRLLISLLLIVPFFTVAQQINVGESGKTYTWNEYTKAKDVCWINSNKQYIKFYIKHECDPTSTDMWVFSGDTLTIDTCYGIGGTTTSYWTKTKIGDTIYPDGNYHVKLNKKFYLRGIPYVATGSVLFYNSGTKEVSYGTSPATFESSLVGGCKFLGSSSTDTLISSTPPIFRRLVKKDLPRNIFYWTTTRNITAGWKSAGDTLGYNFGGLGGGGDTCLWKIVAGHLETKGFDSVWVNHLRINSPTPNLVTNPIFAVNGSVQIFDDVNRWAIIDLSPDYTKSIFSDTTGIALNVGPFQMFGFQDNGIFSPPGNGYLGDDALGMQWDKLYTTKITDDSTNVLLKVPVHSRDTILVTENDTISKMAIADLPVGDSSLFYDDSGSIRNKPTADVHIDTAFTLTGLRSMISSYNNQFVLIVDTTNGNVYRTKLRNFIDTLIIAGMDSSYFWLNDDTVKIKNDYKFYLTDSVYFNRYAIPHISPGEPVGSPLVMRKLNATSIGQLAYTTWQNYGDSLFTNFDTLSYYQFIADTNLWDATKYDLLQATTAHYYDPDASVITKGTQSAGIVNSADNQGGAVWTITEVTGVPGQDFQAIFDSIDHAPNRLLFHGHYDGSVSHSVAIQLWNYTNNSWETYQTLTSRTTDEWVEFTIIDEDEHVRNDSAIVRFYHVASGSASHKMYIDYLALQKTGFGSPAFQGLDWEDTTLTQTPHVVTGYQTRTAAVTDGATTYTTGNDVYDFTISQLGLITIDPIPSSDSTAKGHAITATAGENLIFGNLCYMGSDGKLYKCDADTNISIPGEYICITKAGVSTNSTGTFCDDGYVRCDAWNWTKGGQNGMIYASITAGSMSQTAPTASNDWVQAIGTAFTSDVIHFKPDKLIFQLN